MPRAPSKTEESRPLTPKQRSFLRGLGHTLDPVVLLGHGGLSEGGHEDGFVAVYKNKVCHCL